MKDRTRVKVRITFTGILFKKTADELVEVNAQAKVGKKFECYCQADKLPFGELDIIPKRPFKIDVEIIKKGE